jgi:PadR family transcriptional regulator PadR
MASEPVEADRESLLLKGVLDLCVLSMLGTEPMHAYGLVEALRARGFEQTSYGTIYPLVTRLKRQGLVSQHSEPSESGPARNILTTTEAGESALNAWLPVWRDVTQRVSLVLEPTTVQETVHV